MDVPNGITYAAAGGVLLWLSLQGYRAYQSRNIARDKAEATVDQRAADLIVTVTKPFQDLISQYSIMVEAERAAKSKAEDARDKAVQELVTFMERSQQKQDDKDAKAQEKHDRALARVHERVDACEKEREAEQAMKQVIFQRLDALENRERETLRLTPAPTQVAPIVLQTAPPSTTTISAAGS